MVAKKFTPSFILSGLLFTSIYAADSSLPSGQERFDVSGFLSLWILKDGDLLPLPVRTDIPLNFSIKKPQMPGYIEIESSSFSFLDPLEIKAKISFFYICEKTDSHCSRAYLSAQIKISGATTAFCGSYFSKEDFFPFPVMFCSGYTGSGLAGITLHRKPYMEDKKL